MRAPWSLLLLAAVTSCGRINFDEPPVILGGDAANAARPLCTTPFDPPELIAELASPYSEFGPELTDDGLELFWHDTEPAGLGGDDLWTVTRSTTEEAFGLRALVINVNSAFNEGGLSLSVDGLELYFSSERASQGDGDIYVARRANREASFASAQRIPELAAPSSETGPSPSSDGLSLYFSSDRTGGVGLRDLWVATRTSAAAPYGAPQNLTELNTVLNDAGPTATANGLSIFFVRSQTGQAADLWVATRPTVSDSFSPATSLDELSLPNSEDITPSISASGERITFSSDRRATYDPFVATRVCP